MVTTTIEFVVKCKYDRDRTVTARESIGPHSPGDKGLSGPEYGLLSLGEEEQDV